MLTDALVFLGTITIYSVSVLVVGFVLTLIYAIYKAIMNYDFKE